MTSTIKICGLSTPSSVDTAITGGATYLGFIFFDKSPRNISPEDAAALIPPSMNIKTVAVTVDADNTVLDQIVQTMSPDVLQLHGGESSARLTEIKSRYGLPVMKALAIRHADDFDKVSTYEQVADMLLLDAKAPVGSELPGGNGIRFDWSLIANLKTQLPVLLSGGLDLSNVGEALTIAGKVGSAITGIDVSSGVESAPGVKDDTKIETFLAACKRHSLQD
jgi:phosphoribosylanthranilate isomerase